jgi:hypothetical protein
LAAVCDHVHFWWSDDGPDFWSAQGADGIAPELVRSIATRYAVGRHIYKGREAAYAKKLQETSLLITESMSLVEKSRIVSKFAEDARFDGLTSCVASSAATKLMWFVRPKNWTLYDSYATRPLGIKGATSNQSMKQYYDKLENIGMIEIWEEMRFTMSESKIDFLWPERITDKALWLRGDGAKNLGREHVFSAFGKNNREMIIHISEKISPILAKSKLWTFLN